jgi:very-short-patch-repair endonuclease
MGWPTPDGYIEEARLALEVDSREFHLTPDDWERTLNHHNRLAAAGILVLHFTPKQIREEPSRVRSQIEDAYRERRKRVTAV